MPHASALVALPHGLCQRLDRLLGAFCDASVIKPPHGPSYPFWTLCPLPALCLPSALCPLPIFLHLRPFFARSPACAPAQKVPPRLRRPHHYCLPAVQRRQPPLLPAIRCCRPLFRRCPPRLPPGKSAPHPPITAAPPTPPLPSPTIAHACATDCTTNCTTDCTRNNAVSPRPPQQPSPILANMCTRVVHSYQCGHTITEKAPCAMSRTAPCGVENTKKVKHDEKVPPQTYPDDTHDGRWHANGCFS
ncbi:hypothetical protein P280DRAFT_521030 [Massarina eburnea CBS 473.64]|uniref:Uncharacterized protein n=1 Tax=Massarina eburnea CBS 473.64 TaxID=1395130 RepID=A0A6A6RP65_9PLEO|nr:hypothetical protein P280DRAFT_521030 [Massarina eburnea CBS 473.64]